MRSLPKPQASYSLPEVRDYLMSKYPDEDWRNWYFWMLDHVCKYGVQKSGCLANLHPDPLVDLEHYETTPRELRCLEIFWGEFDQYNILRAH